MSSESHLTSFIGRGRELQEIRDLLGTSRLVTVTGPGGMGKTRLVFELAEQVARSFPDGVSIVELASVEHGADIAALMASSLNVQDQSTRPARERVARELTGLRSLLIIDNCEHVIEAASDLLYYLLNSVDQLSILTTSRQPLNLPGEQIYVLGPLNFPSAGENSHAHSVNTSDAVRLLVDRARTLVPNFEVNEANRSAVVQLCERLDGMPLAIELAATRLRVLTIEQILERLDERFLFLTKGDRIKVARHKTLWNLVDWSHDLCTEAERLMWARLSVFPGTFDLNAVNAVTVFGDSERKDVLDLVDGLVAKSIITPEMDVTAMRYRMLVTIREYGATRLRELGEENTCRRRHRDYYLTRAAEMVDRWSGARQPESLAAMRRDHSNFLAGLAWSTSTPGESETAAEFGSLLRYHWIAGGHLSDGRRWLEKILKLSEQPTARRGAALWVAAWVMLIQGDRKAAGERLTECRDLAAELNDPLLNAHTSHWTGLMQLFRGDLTSAIASYEEAISVFDSYAQQSAAETALFQLAMAQTYDGQLEAALSTCAEVLTRSHSRGEQWCRAYSLWVAGICQWHLGDPVASRFAAMEALKLQRAFQDGICIALTLELLSWLSCDADQFDEAAELAGAATSVWQQLGTSIEAFGPHIASDSKRMTAQIDSSLGVTRANRSRKVHAGISKLDAVELGIGERREKKESEILSSNPLTIRENQVALLVAEGLSNRFIAERLVISRRTVDGHIEHILAKLGFASRAQIAAWASTHRSGETV